MLFLAIMSDILPNQSTHVLFLFIINNYNIIVNQKFDDLVEWKNFQEEKQWLR